MKKLVFILFIFPLPFLGNSTKNDVPKNGRAHISKNTKAQAFKTGKSHVRKNLLHTGSITIKPGFFFDYCLTYEWQDCNAQILYPVTYCSPYSWQDAYNWQADLYDKNVYYLGFCHAPE